MEDGLVPLLVPALCRTTTCLNPCCNGRWSSTSDSTQFFDFGTVLILVVMEDGLVRYEASIRWWCCSQVLILVVMEDGLVQRVVTH